MKRILKTISFAGLAVLAGIGMAHAATAAGGLKICVLVNEMGAIFTTLRTLAFVGAAFFIAQWAWGFIKAGDVKMDDVKDKGIGLIVGFILLFSVAMILQFLPDMAGCNFDAFK